jgi:HSP20 family protein
MTMNVRDLIPWNRGRDVTVRRGEEAYPLLTLHREMNRLFDNVFRGFDLTSFGSERVLTWPNIEVSETGKEVKVRAELPGLEEQDVEVQLSNDVLTIQGEKKTEIEDKDRQV